MPSVIVGPDSYTTIRYSRVKRGRWGLELHAERALDVYTVPIGEMAAWKRHDKFTGSAYLRRRDLQFESNFGPEFDTDWDLIFENPSNEPVRVDYEVFER